MKEITIRQCDYESALRMVDGDIINLINKVDYFGHGSKVVYSYLDELRGSLNTLLFLHLISNDEYHNILACLRGFVFGHHDLDLD